MPSAVCRAAQCQALPIYFSQQHIVASSCPGKSLRWFCYRVPLVRHFLVSSSPQHAQGWIYGKFQWASFQQVPLVCVCVYAYSVTSVVSDSLGPYRLQHQAPLSMEFLRQEYWSGLLCSSPGHLPHPEIKPTSPVAPALQDDSLLLSHQGSPSTGVASHDFSSESACSNTVQISGLRDESSSLGICLSPKDSGASYICSAPVFFRVTSYYQSHFHSNRIGVIILYIKLPLFKLKIKRKRQILTAQYVFETLHLDSFDENIVHYISVNVHTSVTCVQVTFQCIFDVFLYYSFQFLLLCIF